MHDAHPETLPYALHHGDALAVLRDLPAGSVDALITDPPYSSGGMVRGDRTNGDLDAKYVRSSSQGNWETFTGDNRDQRGYAYWCALWLSECVRIVKPGGAVLLFTDWRQLPSTTDALQAGGFVWRGIVPWHKPMARPALGKFTANCEYVVWGSNGPMRQDTGCLPGFYTANSPRDREHMTQKPLDVMRGLVKIVPKGGTVLDPFAGSGTTGVAALLEGRKFIGAEMTEHYHRVAQARLDTAVRGYVDDGEQLALEIDGGAA
jgi:site-specific DNA-methyltransferase (adenine-specific)